MDTYYIESVWNFVHWYLLRVSKKKFLNHVSISYHFSMGTSCFWMHFCRSCLEKPIILLNFTFTSLKLLMISKGLSTHMSISESVVSVTVHCSVSAASDKIILLDKFCSYLLTHGERVSVKNVSVLFQCSFSEILITLKGYFFS